MDGLNLNLIVSNTQKTILKRQHAEKTATQKLFENDQPDFGELTELLGLLGLPANEDDLKTNQRFEKLSRLPQLGIFVYTGTPYVGKDVLPEVVYAFNLKNAIQERYLISPEVNGLPPLS